MAGTGFWWILAACAAYGVLHSVLAANGFKRRVARIIGQAAYDRYYRLLFALMGTLTALPLLALAGLLPDREIYRIPAPWVYLTLLAQALAAAALLITVIQTGAMRFIGFEQALAPGAAAARDRLVISGFYRYVRHPLYTTSFIILWLMPVMTWNLLALVIGLSAYMLIGTIFEERKLVEQFGAAYEEYRRRTPRIVPGIGGKK